MRRSPAYIKTPQIRLPPAVNISHQNIRGVHSEHTQNFIYPSLKCKWPIHTKLLAPNDLISLSYRTQYCVWNDNVYYELKKKIDWNILVLPDQCSRTFWASSRYRYRDTIKLRENQAENFSWNLVPRPISILCSPAQLVVLLGLGLWAVGRVEPWETQGLMNIRDWEYSLENNRIGKNLWET